jgi:hypothetical protein
MVMYNLFLIGRYMTAMGAVNVQLDQKTKDMLSRTSVDDEGSDVHRRRTIENVAILPSTTRSRLSFLQIEMELLWEVEFQWNTGRGSSRGLEELVEELIMLVLCCKIEGCNVFLVLEAMFKLDFKGELTSSK